MLVVYIAGPFRAANTWEVEQNVRRAEALSLEVWAAGHAAVCPHMNTRFFDGLLCDELFLKGDLEIMRRCDAVLLVPGWENSEGTLAEVRSAAIFDIPVFETLEELRSSVGKRGMAVDEMQRVCHVAAWAWGAVLGTGEGEEKEEEAP